MISVQSQQSVKSVVGLFHKYNLMSLPVVDEEITCWYRHADDVLEQVINKK